MARYDYRCVEGHVRELMRGYSVSSVTCPCGLEAQRVAVYAEQTIIGDTVAGGSLGSSVKDKNGRFDLGIFQEASAEVAHAEDKAGVKGPNLYEVGKQRAREMGADIR